MYGVYHIYFYEPVADSFPFTLGTAQLGFATLGDSETPDREVYYLIGWSSLNFTIKLNDSGYHQIRLDLSTDDERLSFLRNTLDVDWIVDIWRRDVNDTTTRVYTGFHLTTTDQYKADGSIIINLYGRHLNSLLDRRVTVPDDGEERYSLASMDAREAMEQIILDHFAAPTDNARTFAGLKVDSESEDHGYNCTVSEFYVNALTVMQNIAEESRGDFFIYAETPGTFVFKTKLPYGKYRFRDNPAGLNPIIFTPTNGLMYIPIFAHNASDYKNFIYMGGAGSGKDKLIVELDYQEEEVDWKRREVYVGKPSISDTSVLTAEANAELNKRIITDKLTFEVVQTDNVRWPVHWQLGDIVEAWYYPDRTFLKKITSVSVDVSGAVGIATESLTVEMEDTYFSFVLGVADLGKDTIL